MYFDSIKSSSDGLSLALAYSLPNGDVRGIIQFSHGMAEHKERYYPFMEFLSSKGYICVIHDHRGHGGSVKSTDDLGYFYTNDINYIVDDLLDVTKYTKSKFKCDNYYMFSHSMGTLVARCYMQKYDKEINKIVLCGTPTYNKLAPLALTMAEISNVFGSRKRDNFLDKLTFNSFNKGYDYKNAWLSKSKKNVDNYNKDNLCGFTFTTNGFINLYKLQIGSFNDKLFKCQNKDLKILMIAGSDDPVIGNEKLFKRLKEFLTNVGYQNIESKLYNSLRHEIFNEDEYNEIYQDVLNFIEGV